MRRTCVRALGRRSQARHATHHSGIEDQVTQDQQASFQGGKSSEKQLAPPPGLFAPSLREDLCTVFVNWRDSSIFPSGNVFYFNNLRLELDLHLNMSRNWTIPGRAFQTHLRDWGRHPGKGRILRTGRAANGEEVFKLNGRIDAEDIADHRSVSTCPSPRACRAERSLPGSSSICVDCETFSE